MYDHLLGEVVEVHAARVVLRASGIGFEVKVPLRLSVSLTPGATTQLFTILHVVDGTPSLLGFGTQKERELARRILGVSSVGPAIALAILSSHPPETFARLVVDGDVAALKQVKGVGAKTAERLCLELRDRVEQLDLLGAVEPGPSGGSLGTAGEDAIAALMTLGYPEKEARKKVVSSAANDPDASTESLIRTVLRGA